MRVGIAEGEGVEAGAENHVLRNAVRDGVCELFFRITAAGDEEGAQGDGEWARLVGRIAAGGAFDLGGVWAEDTDGEGIGEDERIGVEELMRGATHGDAEGGVRGASVIHQPVRLCAGRASSTACRDSQAR